MVAKSSALAQTMGVLNAVTIDGDAVGALTLVGPGAGGKTTASAVAADLADIARGAATPAFGRPAGALVAAERASLQRHEGSYYVRLSVLDRPGSMATIARRMADHAISLESIVQKRAGGDQSEYVSVVMVTHATTETAGTTCRRLHRAAAGDGGGDCSAARTVNCRKNGQTTHPPQRRAFRHRARLLRSAPMGPIAWLHS